MFARAFVIALFFACAVYVDAATVNAILLGGSSDWAREATAVPSIAMSQPSINEVVGKCPPPPNDVDISQTYRASSVNARSAFKTVDALFSDIRTGCHPDDCQLARDGIADATAYDFHSGQSIFPSWYHVMYLQAGPTHHAISVFVENEHGSKQYMSTVSFAYVKK